MPIVNQRTLRLNAPARCRDQRGVVSVEFAIITVVLFMLVQMIIETGWQVATEIALEHGAHNALRFAITGSSTVSGAQNAPGCRAATIVWLVTLGSPGILKSNNLQVSSTAGGANAVASSAPGFGGNASQTTKYTFRYQQAYLTPFAPALMGSPYYPHQVTIVAENEPYTTQPC